MTLNVPRTTRLLDAVNAPLAVRVVKLPAAGAVPPIAGGEANRLVIPAPETVDDALNVVKLPVDPLIGVPLIETAIRLPVLSTDISRVTALVPV